MRSRLLLTLGLSFVLLGASPAFAFQEIKIKEVFAGSAAHPNAQYVVFQAYSAGQNVVTGKSLRTFNSAGTHTGDFTFLGPLPIGADQMTFIVATAEAAALFNLTPDLLMTPVLTPLGGHICWSGSTPDECFAWGNFPGDPALAGTPYHLRAGLIPGYAARRRTDICLTGLLEACDDTNESASDFITVIPDPITNAGVHGTPPPATCANGVLEGLERCDDNNTVDGDGCSAVCRIEPAPLAPASLEVDEHVHVGSDGNGVFEMGETPEVAPSWSNGGPDVAVGGQFTNPLGPADLYAITKGGADYGTIPSAGTANCEDSEDCYFLALPVQARPSLHWDMTADEILSTAGQKTWTLHVGESFPDVPRAHPFYAFIENLFHNRVTGGCAGGYCPGDPVTRAQMAVFLLKASLGFAHVPPPCTGAVFTDVPCTGGIFDPWIEELASLGITGGCGGGNYCPGNAVTREQMAVFLLRALEGAAYDPPDCTQVFADVPCTPGTGFSDWIVELFNRQITGGCGGGNYCPASPNNRGQMAVFLVKTFGLQLYGP